MKFVGTACSSSRSPSCRRIGRSGQLIGWAHDQAGGSFGLVQNGSQIPIRIRVQGSGKGFFIPCCCLRVMGHVLQYLSGRAPILISRIRNRVAAVPVPVPQQPSCRRVFAARISGSVSPPPSPRPTWPFTFLLCSSCCLRTVV